MKLRFFFSPISEPSGHTWLWRSEEAINAKDSVEAGYAKYLGGVFHFDMNALDYCGEVLDEIAELERGDIEKISWVGNAFETVIFLDRVEISHQQFAGHPDWPTWTCTLTDFKAALNGWILFLQMPESPSSEVLVELPAVVGTTNHIR